LNGGLVLVASLNKSTLDEPLEFLNVKLAEIDQSSKQDSIRIKEGRSKTRFHLHKNILALIPQTPIRTIAIAENTAVIAVGCSTGVVVYDSTNGRVLFSKNFLTYRGRDSLSY
jgi:hypothetical protein